MPPSSQSHAYWSRRLDGAPSFSGMAADFAGGRPAVFGRVDLELDADVPARLQALTGGRELPLRTFYLAVIAALLGKYTGAADVCLNIAPGKPAGRRTPVPLRVELNPADDVRATLVAVGTALALAYTHEAAAPTLDASRVQFFVSVGPAAAASEPAPVQWILDGPLGPRPGHLRFDERTFKRDSVAKLGRHFAFLVGEWLRRSQHRAAEISLVSSAERERLLTIFNPSPALPYETSGTIVSRFEAAVRADGSRRAIVAGDRQVTYAALNARANQIAHLLATRGVGPGEVVAVLLPRGIDFIAGVLGVLKTGAAFVPIDPEYPVERVQYMLENSAARAVVCGTAERGKFLAASLTERGPALVRLGEASGEAELAAHATDNLARHVSPTAAAYVLYTSGSTGRPKGAVIRHDGALNHILAQAHALGLAADLVFLQSAPASSDISVWQMLAPLVLGGTTYVVPTETLVDPPRLLDLLQRGRITLLEFVPIVLRALLDHAAARAPEARVLPALRWAMVTGEAVPPDLVNRWFRTFPAIPLVNAYGPTEAADDVCQQILRGPVAESQLRVPVGEPLPGNCLYVLDRAGLLMPIGVPGEICVSGVGVGAGYWRDAAKTAASFQPNPYHDGWRGPVLYRTGDCGRWRPDGTLEVLGRFDHQIKLRGHRIELDEIEAVLRGCAGVDDAVALLLPEDAGDERQIHAFLRTPVEVPEAVIRAHCEARLPGPMRPTRIRQRREFPVAPSGKVDRAGLARLADDTAAEPRVAPRDDRERQVAQIWNRVLGKSDHAGIDADFFALGGHSLKAVQIVGLLREATGLDLNVRDVLEHPTVRRLAQRVGEVGVGAAQVIPVAEPREWYPVTSAQKRLFLLQTVHGGAAYNLPAAFRVAGPVDWGRFARAVGAVIAAHEILRTEFALVDGEVRQRVRPPEDFQIEQLAPQDWPEAYRSFVRAFDVGRPPLVRFATVCDPREGATYLFYDTHHLVTDGASDAIFAVSLLQAYAGQPLAPLPVQFKDYAVWEEESRANGRWSEHATYWQSEFAEPAPKLAMPLDHPRPRTADFAGAQHHFELDEALTQRVLRLAEAHQCTPFVALLSAYSLLLARSADQPEVVVGTPATTRSAPVLDALIGMFANTVALRVPVAASATVADYLDANRRKVLAAMEHAAYPFERLVEEVERERDLSRNPIFDCFFTLQHATAATGSGDRLPLQPVRAEKQVTKFDLSLVVIEGRGRIRCLFEYRTSLFEPETIAELGRRFLGVLEQLSGAEPSARLGEFSLCSPEQRSAIVRSLALPPVAAPDWRPAHVSVAAQARCRPEHVAVCSGTQQITYGLLNAKANGLAAALRPRIEAGSIVAVAATPTPETIVAFLALLKLGAAFLPVDVKVPPERIDLILRDSGVQCLLGHPAALARVGPVAATRVPLAFADLPAVSTDPSLQVMPGDAAYVIFTSGSTGRPKGVVLEHRGLANLIDAQAEFFSVQPDDRVLQFASFGFDASVSEIFVTLARGATLCLRAETTAFAADVLAAELRDRRITMATLPPPLLRVLSPEGLPWFRTVISAGDVCTPEVARKWSVGRRLINAYGPTEMSVCATMETVAPGAAEASIGAPMLNTRAVVRDQDGNLQPPGAPGEIWLAGHGIARGYLNQPELTADRFVPAPFAPDLTLYRTGDRGRWSPDGSRLHFFGRSDGQAKIRGFRVEPNEVVRVLLTLPEVTDAVVLVAGTEERELHAYLASGASLDLDAVRERLRRSLPPYMIPARFHQVAELPTNASGKVDVARLQREARRLRPRDDVPGDSTALEREIAAIWRAVLKLEHVGVTDFFFDVGGNSLNVVELKQRLTPVVPRPFAIADLFSHPTIRDFAGFCTGVAEPAAESAGMARGQRRSARHRVPRRERATAAAS